LALEAALNAGRQSGGICHPSSVLGQAVVPVYIQLACKITNIEITLGKYQKWWIQ
jgi:hypothetical protein